MSVELKIENTIEYCECCGIKIDISTGKITCISDGRKVPICRTCDWNLFYRDDAEDEAELTME